MLPNLWMDQMRYVGLRITQLQIWWVCVQEKFPRDEKYMERNLSAPPLAAKNKEAREVSEASFLKDGLSNAQRYYIEDVRGP